MSFRVDRVGKRIAHLANHETEKLESSVSRNRSGSVEDIEQQRRHEERRIDSSDMYRRLPCHRSKIARSRGITSNRNREELSDQGHRVDVVLPDVEPSRTELGRHRLVEWMLCLLEIGRDRCREIGEHRSGEELEAIDSDNSDQCHGGVGFRMRVGAGHLTSWHYRHSISKSALKLKDSTETESSR